MNNAVTRSFVRRSKGTTTYLFTVFDFGAVKRNLLHYVLPLLQLLLPKQCLLLLHFLPPHPQGKLLENEVFDMHKQKQLANSLEKMPELFMEHMPELYIEILKRAETDMLNIKAFPGKDSLIFLNVLF